MSGATDAPAVLVFAGGRWRSGVAARELRAAGLPAATRRCGGRSVLAVEVPVLNPETLELVRSVTGRDPRIRLLHRSDLPAHVDQPSHNRGRDERQG